jgi:ribosomal protein S18 acetylase RimI-like enzyme
MPFRRPWAFERGTLWAMDLDGAGPTPAASHTAAAFGEVSWDEADALAAAMGLTDPGAARQRLAHGRRCFAVWVAGEIAAYGWVSQGEESVGELERAFRLQPDAAYIWDCATLPPFRRRGLYSSLLRHIAGTLRAEGVRRLWIGASRRNRPSIVGFANAGFQPVINLTYVRVLGLRHTRIIDDKAAPPGLVAAARSLLGSADRRGKTAALHAARPAHAEGSAEDAGR